ncbi:MAG: stage II sporulation protein M, partial [Anaerolineales bacterium]|nr:stage II sporulation protein M [Anaerolineales bacterium]
SSQTTSTRAANLLASFIIIPMVLLIQAESIIMFWGNYSILWWAIIGQIIIAALLIRTGVAHFNREELLGQEFDTLNLRWAWSKFSSAFLGSANSVIDWFLHEIPKTLRRLLTPIVLITLMLILATIIGATQASRFVVPVEALNLDNLGEGFFEGLEEIRFFSIGSVWTVLLQNLRVLALATLVGLFSFGVLGVVILMIPMMIIGYFAATVANVGISPLLFFSGFVLPHGILEIPAIILAGAAILRMGATLAAPSHGQTIGESWLHALADWARVMVAIVAPLLLAAAVIEVFITPRIAILIFGN